MSLLALATVLHAAPTAAPDGQAQVNRALHSSVARRPFQSGRTPAVARRVGQPEPDFEAQRGGKSLNLNTIQFKARPIGSAGLHTGRIVELGETVAKEEVAPVISSKTPEAPIVSHISHGGLGSGSFNSVASHSSHGSIGGSFSSGSSSIGFSSGSGSNFVSHGSIGSVGSVTTHGVVGGSVVGHEGDSYDEKPDPFHFTYGVHDDQYYTDFSESRTGDAEGNIKGEYQVALPDGRVQHVTYVADGHYGGTVMEVSYSGEARYPDISSGYHS